MNEKGRMVVRVEDKEKTEITAPYIGAMFGGSTICGNSGSHLIDDNGEQKCINRN
jgi:hypothetical protein